MAEPAANRRKVQTVGSDRPRIAPPRPARTLAAEFAAEAKAIGLTPWPWQMTAARYVYAIGPRGSWQFPEVAIIVSRQNGKSEFLVPHIVRRLEMGRRVLHAAQQRDLARLTFLKVASVLEARHGKAVDVRRAGGQETVTLGHAQYKIVAATAGGPRGFSADDVVLDEVRELEEDFVGAVLPTAIASDNPQFLYLSNAGDDTTRVLNSIRDRATLDPSLAYLEWSAPPDLAADALDGWLQANPAIGHKPSLLANLGRLYLSHKLAGTLAVFETEYLCRWVTTLRERLVDEYDWVGCRSDEGLGQVVRPSYAVAMDPSGSRASLAVAWQAGDLIGLRLQENRIGSPVDLDSFGEVLRKLPANAKVGYDPLTDAELVKYMREGKGVSIAGAKFANASAQFVNAIAARRLAWADADPVTDDLTWTARKMDASAAGAYQAVRAKDDHPVTAALAAIRAVWLASGPGSAGPPRIR